MTSERLPPHDIDAEEAVISSLLIDGEAIHKITTILQDTEPFYHEPNRWLFQACLSLYQRNEAINQITVAQELDRQGKLKECGGAAYLSHLISTCPTPLDIEHYARIVYRLAVSRRLIDAARRIEAIGYEANPDVDESLNKADEALFKIRFGQSPRYLNSIRQVLDKYFEVPPSPEGEGDQPVPHVLSGFNGLDDFLGGFQRSDLIIVAGRPSMGKTSFALSVALNAAVKQGACSAIFSLEMSQDSLAQRMVASEANVDSRRVGLGRHTTEDEEKRIMNVIGVLSEAPIYIDDSPQLRVVELRSKARRLHFERGIDLIVVDYLQLMQGDSRTDNRVQEIGYISRSLKALARELNVPVLAVSQLSRAVEFRASHKPQLADLRESGSIEQDADLVLFIYRDDYYYKKEEWENLHPDQEYPEGIADIMIAKHRNGPTGEIKLHFTPKSAKFADIARQEPSLL